MTPLGQHKTQLVQPKWSDCGELWGSLSSRLQLKVSTLLSFLQWETSIKIRAPRCRLSVVGTPACFVCKNLTSEVSLGEKIYRWNYGTAAVKANRKADIWWLWTSRAYFLGESQTDMSSSTQVWRRCGERVIRQCDSHKPQHHHLETNLRVQRCTQKHTVFGCPAKCHTCLRKTWAQAKYPSRIFDLKCLWRWKDLTFTGVHPYYSPVHSQPYSLNALCTMILEIRTKQPRSFVFNWQSKSADLSSTETVFHRLNTRLKGKVPQNKQEVKAAAEHRHWSVTPNIKQYFHITLTNSYCSTKIGKLCKTTATLLIWWI